MNIENPFVATTSYKTWNCYQSNLLYWSFYSLRFLNLDPKNANPITLKVKDSGSGTSEIAALKANTPGEKLPASVQSVEVIFEVKRYITLAFQLKEQEKLHLIVK